MINEARFNIDYCGDLIITNRQPVRERAGPTCKGGNDTNFYKYSHGAGALSHNHMDSIGWYVGK